MSAWRKAIRTAQNYVPFLAEAKNDFYHFTRSRLGRVHEGDFALLTHLPWDDGDLCLDIGANRGQSILAIRRFRPAANIVSFEPNPLIFARLQRRFGHLPGVTLHPFGLGSAPGRFPLFVPSYGRFTYDGCASFSAEAARDYFSAETLFFFDPTQVSLRQYDCEVRTLDSLDLSPRFIKIDVEGFEYEVLLGGRDTLRRCRPALLLERGQDRPALDGLLAEHGYREVAWRDGRFVPERRDGLNRLLLAFN